jgi:flagellar protein FliO/FliZ
MKARAWRARPLSAASRTVCRAGALLMAGGWLNAAHAANEHVASGAIVASGVVGGGLNVAGPTVASQALGAGSAVPSYGIEGLFQAVFGLALVIGLIFGCAWLARRFGLNRPIARGGLVKVISSTPLSQKERVVVIEIEDTWLVLGVAPGSVSHLHTLPAGEFTRSTPGPVVPPQVSQFALDLRQRLNRKAGKPADRGDSESAS